MESQNPVSGQVELTGAAVREPTGIALPARHSTRDSGGGRLVSFDEAAGRRFPQSADALCSEAAGRRFPQSDGAAGVPR